MQVSNGKGFGALMALCLMIMLAPTSRANSDVLQCVPYARTVSGIEIRGDAHTWWDQAEGRYSRGSSPRKGAVMVFAAHGPMVLGHVAVVSKILNDREVLIRHANWSQPGAIEEDVVVRDVSDEGDWSAVRVWNSPTEQMGARTNPVVGFIYASKPRLNPFRPDLQPARVRFAYLTPAPKASSGTKVERTVLAAAPTPKASQVALNDSRVKPGRTDRFIIEYGDGEERTANTSERSLADIIADVRKNARI
jgi:CHAP domain